MSNRPLAFEDFEPGMEISMGPYHVTAEEIIEFASEFDPQPMHVDEEAGKASMLGGLAASGWHTVSMAMRMMCDTYLLNSTSQGAPGVDYVKWKRPVLAGDTLTGKTTIKHCRRSKSRPGIGFVDVVHDIFNQHGECVCELANTGMFLLRNPEAA